MILLGQDYILFSTNTMCLMYRHQQWEKPNVPISTANSYHYNVIPSSEMFFPRHISIINSNIFPDVSLNSKPDFGNIELRRSFPFESNQLKSDVFEVFILL